MRGCGSQSSATLPIRFQVNACFVEIGAGGARNVLSAGRNEDSLWWSYGLGAGCMMVSSVVVTSPTGVTASASIVCVRRSRPSRTGTGEAGAGGR
jgi:hypothetical protein